MKSFAATLAAFRATTRTPATRKPAGTVKKVVTGFTSRREDKALALSHRANYAIPQPKLCEQMPHRFFPVRAQCGFCIRCGVMEGSTYT